MSWYRSGSVALTAGQATVTGTGTAFSANGRVGDAFQGPDGRWYEVTNIASGTVLSILPAYQGATVSGGAYGLAPMQGYVKESADRLRQTVEQFGATLALLGTPSSAAKLRENIGAASRGVNSDITSLTGMTTALSVAQGGTGGTTAVAARAGLGLKKAAEADIVGSVSQAAGVPTGAIIERGSNTNGDFVKFADGTMHCVLVVNTGTFTTNVSNFLGSTSGVTYYTNTSLVFPATFAATPVLIPVVSSGSPFASRAFSISLSGGVIQTYSASTSPCNIFVLVTGRWF